MASERASARTDERMGKREQRDNGEKGGTEWTRNMYIIRDEAFHFRRTGFLLPMHRLHRDPLFRFPRFPGENCLCFPARGIPPRGNSIIFSRSDSPRISTTLEADLDERSTSSPSPRRYSASGHRCNLRDLSRRQLIPRFDG